MQARDHQSEIAGRALSLLREYGIVYLAMEERTGKTLTSILVCEATIASNILVITKKKALPGWFDTLAKFKHTKNYEVVNYHSAHKTKMKPDIVILDEAHSYISGYPKHSVMWAKIKLLTYRKPIIYMSATPKAQGNQLLYGQLALSSYSPWANFRSYYDWFKKYAERDARGMVKTVKINAADSVIDYSAVQQELVWDEVKHLFITKTRAELGFEHEPTDRLHYIELTEKTKTVYNTILKHRAIDFTLSSTGKDYTLVCDSPIKLRWSLHMLEGGTLKIDNEYISLWNTEKIDYILKTWGDSDDLVIMYHYKAEKIKLEKFFVHATLLQGTSYAEGVDLHKYKNLVIYSQDFSTAKHTQRRARQANMERNTAIDVHYLLVKKAVSEQVYKTCSLNKKDFVDSTFRKETL